MSTLRVTVLTGGSSAERDVALASAVQVVGALRKRGHQVAVVDTALGPILEKDESSQLSPRVGKDLPDLADLAEREQKFLLTRFHELSAVREADVLFLALHGGRGEDGTLQTILEVIGVPYTGSGPLPSGLAMDKDVSKRLFRASGIKTADWLMTPASAQEVEDVIGWPAVVKPSKQGSTVGLTIVKRSADYTAAVELAGQYDDEIMIEAFIPGRELTVGVLDGVSLPTGEIIPRHEIFDYECKYTPGMSEEIFPADLPGEVARECGRLALEAHQVLKLGGYSRVDFRMTPEGALYCLEANTLPGMTATSLLPQGARAAGIAFEELCDRICRSAIT
jgi:D-alanine-D-alanine ligase